MLDLKLVRQNAQLKAKDNFYTWIAPDRVIAMIDEIERLRAREAEAIRLLNVAFGEYSCGARQHLPEDEVRKFENNFAEAARRFLHEPR